MRLRSRSRRRAAAAPIATRGAVAVARRRSASAGKADCRRIASRVCRCSVLTEDLPFARLSVASAVFMDTIVKRAARDRILEFLSPRPECHAVRRRWAPPSHAGRSPGGTGAHLLGRQREREALGRLLNAASGGDGGVLVVHGEPGVGKTALLEWAVEEARQLRVLRTVGVEGEMELPFAALQQLCSPILDLSGASAGSPARRAQRRLRAECRTGLRTRSWSAWRRSACCPRLRRSGRCCVSWMTRSGSIVRQRARSRSWPVACSAEKIAFVFAARELGDALAGLPELRVEPLGRRDARTLLESVLPAPLDEHVLDRIVLETHGNPLALLELPRGLTPTQLAGGFGLPVAVPLSTSIEESFTRRLARLPGDARRLLLVAAADPIGDPALVWRAARQLGIPESARRRAVEAEDLLELGARVVFRHPLVRSAVYRRSRAEGAPRCPPSPGGGNRSAGRS